LENKNDEVDNDSYLQEVQGAWLEWLRLPLNLFLALIFRKLN